MTQQQVQQRDRQLTRQQEIDALQAEIKKLRETLDILCRFIAENGRKKK
jgi:hypothetical protein